MWGSSGKNQKLDSSAGFVILEVWTIIGFKCVKLTVDFRLDQNNNILRGDPDQPEMAHHCCSLHQTSGKMTRKTQKLSEL